MHMQRYGLAMVFQCVLVMLFILFAVIGSRGNGGEPVQDNNLLKNGDFTELGKNGLPLNWAAKSDEVRLSPHTEPGGNPEKFIMVESLIVDEKLQGLISQNVDGLAKNRVYRLSGWIKSLPHDTAYFQIKLYKDGKEFKRINSPVSDEVWRRVDLEFSTEDSDRIQVLCRFHRNNPNHAFWFAGLELVDAGRDSSTQPEKPKPAANILPGSSFEEQEAVRGFTVGDGEYRAKPGHCQIDESVAYHGSRSLKLSDGTPYTQEVMARHTTDAVTFSAALRTSAEGQTARIGVEQLFFNMHGGIKVRTCEQKVDLNSHWQRLQITMPELPGDKSAGYPTEYSKYRVWVALEGENTLWVDAVQLELGREVASAYSPLRGNNKVSRDALRADAISILERRKVIIEDSPQRGTGENKRGLVRLSVRETGGIARVNEPVWGGVPFPAGELFDADAILLKDSAGRNVPCQGRALARRPSDGSIISLLLDFQASVKAGAAAEYTLAYGEMPGFEPKKLAVDKGGEILIDTGAVKAGINKDSFVWFSSLASGDKRLSPEQGQTGSFVLAPDGVLYSSAAGAPQSVEIESNGPMRTVILVRGRHQAEDGGEEFISYEARIHAFAGKPYFLLEHSFEQQEKNFYSPVSAIFLRLPHAQSAGAEFAFGLQGQKDITGGLSDNTLMLTQVRDYFGAGGYSVYFAEGAKSREFSGIKASGRLRVGETMIEVGDFWQLNPKALELSGNSVGIYHWPRGHTRNLDLNLGVSNTLQLMYAPFGGGGALAHAPLLLQPEQKWVVDSGVFGRFMTEESAAKEYSGYNRILRNYFSVLKKDQQITGISGMFDYGDLGAPYAWSNNETTVLRNLFLQYLRGYDPALFRRATDFARHQRDVDVCHGRPDAAYMHVHAPGTHWSHGIHMGHFWLKGLLWHYYLTGDGRTYHTLRKLGAMLLEKHSMPKYAGRERARTLLHLADLYELTHWPEFRKAFETHYNFDHPTDSGSYYGGIGLLALINWYEITGEDKYRKRLEQDVVRIVTEWKEAPADNASKDKTKRFSIGEGRDWHIFYAMGKAARLFDNRECITAFTDWFVWHLVNFNSADHCAVLGSEFLMAASDMGIPVSGLMPEYIGGIGVMTGNLFGRLAASINNSEGVNRFRFCIPADRQTDFTVYRLRRFRYWLYNSGVEEDEVIYRVLGPDGAELANKHLNASVQGEAGTISLPNIGENTEYTVIVDCVKEGWAEVAATHSGFKLDADRYFGFRTGRSWTGYAQFGFTAPENPQQLRLLLDWGDDYAGKALGVLVEDEQGRAVSQKRWVVPAGTQLARAGKAAVTVCTEFDLQVPAGYANQPLRLTVFGGSAKWVAWKLAGLQDAWFSIPNAY